ncbi:GNAT family N-acetyltransferase, partial [Streptomyces sp. 8K308]|uniref:GNAT family N-acetyltransferase n=1 Tax=Streptomyces sp. 8K308 TaxID=2530388 RepID=UPI0010DB3942
MIELRELGEDDWRVWRELRLAALAEAPYAFGTRLAEWQGEGDREERWRARLAIPGAADFVALVDGGPAGTASGVPGDEGPEVLSVWVAAAARGRG